MTFPARLNLDDIRVIDVARELLGSEDLGRSTSQEKHFKGHGGLFVNIGKNKWYSHGAEKGGDATALICFVTGCEFSAAVAWLRSHGFIGPAASLKSRVVCTYAYADGNGVVRCYVDRHEPKRFSQWREVDGERLNGVTGGLYERSRSGDAWWRVKDKPRPGAETREFPAIIPVPYRLPELLQSSEQPVLIAGGEKDVDNLRGLGFTATCNHGGEGKWWSELTPYLKGRRVFILCDNDAQGEKH